MQNIAKKFCLQRIRNINSTPLYESQVDVVRRIRSNTSYGTTELDSYIDLISCTGPTSITPDTLQWWKTMEKSYQTLVPIVKSTLCILASSTPSERVYSYCNNIVTKKRNRLHNDTAKQLAFISVNSRLLAQYVSKLPVVDVTMEE